jgi:hypothetical protein
MYDDYDTDYSQLDYSDDYASKSKQKSYDNDSKKKEKKLQEEIALLRKMLTVQETIEKTLRKEVQKFKKIALSQREIIRTWAPHILSKEDKTKSRRSTSSVSTTSYRERAPSSPTRSMRSSQSPSLVRDERAKQQDLYDRERYIIPDKYAPSSPARPRSPPKETIRLSTGSLSHGIDFRPTGGNAKIPDVPPPLPRSPFRYHETAKPHKEITPSKVRKTRSPTRKTLNTSTERSMNEVMREAEELIEMSTKMKTKTKSKSSSLSPAPSKKKTSTKRRSKSTTAVNRSVTSIDSLKGPTKKSLKPKKKKKSAKSITAMALKREVNKILKEIANETQ